VVPDLPVGVRIAGFLVLLYLPPFVVSPFMVKRGLMLGAAGRASYFPGTTPGRGAYGVEGAILDMMGLKRREFPIDLLIYFFYAALFLAGSGDVGLGETVAGLLYLVALFVFLASVVSIVRRARTHRW
jgi:hypothetical protein